MLMLKCKQRGKGYDVIKKTYGESRSGYSLIAVDKLKKAI